MNQCEQIAERLVAKPAFRRAISAIGSGVMAEDKGDYESIVYSQLASVSRQFCHVLIALQDPRCPTGQTDHECHNALQQYNSDSIGVFKGLKNPLWDEKGNLRKEIPTGERLAEIVEAVGKMIARWVASEVRSTGIRKRKRGLDQPDESQNPLDQPDDRSSELAELTVQAPGFLMERWGQLGIDLQMASVLLPEAAKWLQGRTCSAGIEHALDQLFNPQKDARGRVTCVDLGVRPSQYWSTPASQLEASMLKIAVLTMISANNALGQPVEPTFTDAQGGLVFPVQTDGSTYLPWFKRLVDEHPNCGWRTGDNLQTASDHCRNLYNHLLEMKVTKEDLGWVNRGKGAQ